MATKGLRTVRLKGKRMVIVEAGHESVFLIREIGSDLGRGFRLDELPRIGDQPEEGGSFRVSLSGDGLNDCGCDECATYQTCRHCEAVRALIGAGRIGGGYPQAVEQEQYAAFACIGA